MNEHIHAQNLGEAILLGPEHLDEDTIVFLADGSLSGEAKVDADAHLAACDDCSYLVSDLRSFRAVAEPHRWDDIVQKRRRSRAPLFGLAAAASLAGVIAVSVLRNDSAVPPAVSTATAAPASGTVTVATQPLTARARTTMSLRDGNSRIALLEDGSVTGVSAAHATLVRDALTSRKLPEVPYLAELTTVASTLRGPASDGRLTVLEPVGAVIADARPRFRWTPLEGAVSYRVSVLTENFDPIMESPLLTVTEWTPDRDLPRDRTVTWQVAAQTSSGEVVAPGTAAGDARFHILSAAASDELRDLGRERSHLVRGLVYAKHGLLQEAEGELSQVAANNTDSAAAQSLLAAVREKLPQR